MDTMKPSTCLIAATVAVAITACQNPIDCADWNTGAFFEAAEVSDVARPGHRNLNRLRPRWKLL